MFLKQTVEMPTEEEKKETLVPMMESGVHAGFPSPAQDYINSFIDLNKELVRHPAATFFARVVGDSMVDADVNEGDVLVVDKSIEPREGDMAVCFIDGEFTLKHISFHDPAAGKSVKAARPGVSYDILRHQRIWLLPANENYPPIEVTESNDFTVWGIVTYVIKKVCTR
jgi:DNA polymerase V